MEDLGIRDYDHQIFALAVNADGTFAIGGTFESAMPWLARFSTDGEVRCFRDETSLPWGSMQSLVFDGNEIYATGGLLGPWVGQFRG